MSKRIAVKMYLSPETIEKILILKEKVRCENNADVIASAVRIALNAIEEKEICVSWGVEKEKDS